jgi:hypothetical protein
MLHISVYQATKIKSDINIPQTVECAIDVCGLLFERFAMLFPFNSGLVL